MIVRIALSRFKTFRYDQDDGDEWWFPYYNRLHRLKFKRHAVACDVSGSDNGIFARVSETSQT